MRGRGRETQQTRLEENCERGTSTWSDSRLPTTTTTRTLEDAADIHKHLEEDHLEHRPWRGPTYLCPAAPLEDYYTPVCGECVRAMWVDSLLEERREK